MTFPNTKIDSLPRFIENYSLNHGVDELEKLLNECSISGEEPLFHLLSLKDQQLLLLMLFKQFATDKKPHTLKQIVHGLICYVDSLNSTPDETVIPFATQEFTDLVMRPTTLLDLALSSRLKVLQKNIHKEHQDKKTEWKNTLKIFSKLAHNYIHELPLTLFAEVLHEHKSQTSPSNEALAFALCRLSEVFYVINKTPEEDINLLHIERCNLLSEYIKTEEDSTLNFYLFAQVLKEHHPHPINSPMRECKSEDTLSSQELDIFIAIVTSPHTPEHVRNEILQTYKNESATTKTRELAQRIEDTMLLKNVPLKAFLAGENVDAYLNCLYSMLRGYKRQKFHEFSPHNMRANFLLFLACSVRKNDSNSLTLLLLSLPYCIQYLDGLCSNALSQSIDGSEEDLTTALAGRIEDFLHEEETLEQSTNEWPSINQVLRHIAASQIEDPLLLLQNAVVAWNVVAKPDPKAIAIALRACADFAHGFTHAEESIQSIAYSLLESLARDDEKRLGASGSLDFDELFMIKALFRLLKLDGRELDGKNPGWTTTLEGQELELFISLANSPRATKPTRAALFPYYTKNGASEKCHFLAIRIAPNLAFDQLLQLARKLEEPSLSLFVDTVNSQKFPHDYRERLVRHFFNLKTIEGLSFAARISPCLGPSWLTAFLRTLDETTPSICVTEQHQHTLRHLCNARWLNDKQTTLFTLDDDKTRELLALLNKVTNKFWLEEELTADFFQSKIKILLEDTLRAGKRSPSPEASLRPIALKKSASELLPRESVEVLMRVVQKDYGKSSE